KEEITDLIGIRAIHIFKEDWEDIHSFIASTWKIIEITANVRDGDDKQRFEELNIKINSRKSGYRSVHYLIEFFPTSQRVIAEIQVRTIFEEGYGEIDHQLRYSHKEIPAILASNLLLFNRIAGSSDEMASFINLLNKNLTEIKDEYEKTITLKDEIIKELQSKLK
ncbi:MAG: GTP pyrophosphokinase, partial [Sporomusaceae bacterium]|nr:GTP pyrophosphokinase [Sporomusaceae bacterium]